MNAREQFGRQASAYATSPVHIAGVEELVALLAPSADAVGVDIGTGAGHTAHALARRCGYVLAMDITPEMLAETRRLAGELSLANVQAAFALAESLPFADASFDVATCRYAAHHFQDVPAFLRELRRVLKPAGRAVIFDTVAQEVDEVAAFVNDVEWHRDHSHVDDLKVSAWRRQIAAAGLTVVSLTTERRDTDHELYDWALRAGAAAEEVEYVRRRFESASPAVVEALGLHRDGASYRWGWLTATILVRRG